MTNNREINFNNFTFKYKSQKDPTLKEINFTIGEAEKILVIGPSGSGKSTIAKAINGQIPNTYDGDILGEVKVCNKDIKESSIFDLSLKVGTVLQDTDGQFVGLTVAEDIAFSLENDNVKKEEMLKEVNSWAEVLAIKDLLNQKPGELSGGQKQRVSLAGVLVSHTPILLLDEPLANLDPASGLSTMKLVDKLNKNYGCSIIVIEHRLEEALSMKPDRILIIDDGKLIFDGKTSDLLKMNLLDEIGVRKPLYIKALDYSKVDVGKYDSLSNFEDTNILENDLLKIKNWADSIKVHQDISKKNSILQVRNLCFSYGKKKKTLDDLSFTINKGDIVSLVGPNGAGKSTLAKLLCGFIRPTSGEIILDNENIKNKSIKEIAEKIGFCLQNPNAMISKTSVKEEVAFGLKLRNVKEEEIIEKSNKILEICGLYPFRNWPIAALSYGQKRRVTIASILILDPQILILDEPTAGQDYKHYTEIMEFIKSLNKKLNLTILMISHDMHLIQEYTDRTLVIANGKLLADTSANELFANSKLLEKASLTETSLYKLAKKINYEPKDFIEKFISYERGNYER